LGFAEKAKENSKSILSRLASVDNASDSATGLRPPTVVTNEICLRAHAYPSGCGIYMPLAHSGQKESM
jgi:hypothetical protein